MGLRDALRGIFLIVSSSFFPGQPPKDRASSRPGAAVIDRVNNHSPLPLPLGPGRVSPALWCDSLHENLGIGAGAAIIPARPPYPTSASGFEFGAAWPRSPHLFLPLKRPLASMLPADATGAHANLLATQGPRTRDSASATSQSAPLPSASLPLSQQEFPWNFRLLSVTFVLFR